MEIRREHYLAQIRPSINSDIIKVLTGVRRSGKSVLLNQIRSEVSKVGISDDHIVQINFEDVAFDKLRNYQKLNSYILSKIKDKRKYYVFLDEIQHVRNFEKTLASLKATQNVSLFVSGSNSKLLSGRLATLLVGRCLEFRILPFSYEEAREYLNINSIDEPKEFFNDYLVYGGFPQRFDYSGDIGKRKYLETIYKGIVEKDICTPKSNINKDHFLSISNYVMANSGKQFSAKKIADYFERENDWPTKKQIVYRYLDKMEKACLISRVKRYDVAAKRTLKQIEKQYVVDGGLRTVNLSGASFPRDYALENLVYNELIYRGFDVKIGKTYKGEIDFVAYQGMKKRYIQVAYLLSDEGVIEREFGAFSSIKDASPRYVLSLDPIDGSRDGIENINIQDWLNGKQLLRLS